MAVKDCYTNYNEVDYNKDYDGLSKKWEIPEYLIDHNRLDVNPDDTLPQWQMRPDLKHVVSLTFRYKTYHTSNNNARDTLHYGTCETLISNIQLWGFETYQEFRDHLAVRDKAQARDIWDELSTELRNQTCRYLFWIPKNDQHLTEPGCWAITLETQGKRSAIVWSGNELRCWSNLRLTNQNKVIIGKED